MVTCGPGVLPCVLSNVTAAMSLQVPNSGVTVMPCGVIVAKR